MEKRTNKGKRVSKKEGTKKERKNERTNKWMNESINYWRKIDRKCEERKRNEQTKINWGRKGINRKKTLSVAKCF